MTNLAQFTNAELTAELERRAEEQRLIDLELRRREFRKLIQHREALLDLISHSRTSCSDERTINGFGSADSGARCARCALLELDELDADLYDVKLELTFTTLK